SAGPANEIGKASCRERAEVPVASLGVMVISDGTTVVSSGTGYTLAQIRGMQFRAAADANGGPATFSYTVSDDGTTAGANDFKTLTQSLTITVTEVNDAPTRTAGSVANLQVAEYASTTGLGLGAVAYSAGPANESGQNLTYTVTAVPASSLGDVVLSDGTTVLSLHDALPISQIRGMQFRAAADAN